MVYFQQSLFGRTSWERFFQMTGWTLEPCSQRSQPPTFQCLLLEDGQEPEWCEGTHPISHGGSWMPSIGQTQAGSLNRKLHPAANSFYRLPAAGPCNLVELHSAQPAEKRQAFPVHCRGSPHGKSNPDTSFQRAKPLWGCRAFQSTELLSHR